ncbi:Vitamin B12 transporter BtuB [Brevundimonas sp. NIBR10]|uniref:TonB-dependent receptor plug domain-containing protein n=1 Tax=Brevundimonas sp. NIBR10 TaxID=3015997 RepID=UPI0022F1CAB6|nr:TonB-dependent receptor [Brevundimonas sp. NIBR10]WGM45939.1 Vitamin B12 transporter BtuB [Brevundimonas sp. NIBR10]
MITTPIADRRRLLGCVGLAALCGLTLTAAGGAHAQTAEPTADEVEAVTVTGTRIRGGTVASPVVVIGQEEIRARGAATAEEIINLLPQNLSALNSSSFASKNQSTESLGESAPNLRGLGTNATLVLINGRRVAGSASFDGSTFNLSSIPANAIERVEVLLDGASAIYGSDAIGGVINVILKTDLPSRFETTVRQEIGENGADRTSLSQVISHDWSGGRMIATLGYSKTDPVRTADYGLSSMDYRDRGGDDFRITSFSQPGVVYGYGALPASSAGVVYTPADLSDANIVPVSILPLYLRPEGEQSSATVYLEQTVSQKLRLYVDALYSRTDTRQIGQAPSVSFAYVPETNAFNRFGEDVFVSYLFANEVERGVLPRNTSRSRDERFHINLGGEYSLPIRDWSLDAYAVFSRETSESSSRGLDLFSDAFADALAGATLATALNLFGNGSAQNDALLSSLVGDTGTLTNESRVTGANLGLSGGLITLPAGEVRFAAGAEFRREVLDYSGSPTSAMTFNTDTLPRDITSVYAQVDVPLLKDKAFARRLSLTLAGRWEEYALAGDFDSDGAADDDRSFSQFSPQVGLLWQPFTALRLRATYGESFRTPDPRQLFLPTQLFPDTIPLLDYAAPGGPDIAFVTLSSGGNPDLQPETARTWTLGFDYAPQDKPWNVRVGYNVTRFENLLGNTVDLLFGDFAEYVFTHPDQFPGTAVRDAAGNLVQVNINAINLSSRVSETIDVGGEYAVDAGDLGLFTASFNATFTLRLDDELVPGLDAVARRDNITGADRYVAVASLNWTRRDWRANVAFTYRPSYGYAAFNTGEDRRADDYLKADASLGYTFDNTGSAWRDGVRITAGVRNLIGSEAGYVGAYSTTPYDSSRYDVRGRTGFLEIAKAF